MSALSQSLSLAFIAIVLFGSANAQQIEVSVVFTGVSSGEPFAIRAHGIPGIIIQEDPLMKCLSLGVGDPATMRERVEGIELYVGNVHASYTKIPLSVPKGINRYLILKRDKTLKRGQYFVVSWPDALPYPEESSYEHIFARDTAVHSLPVPMARIMFGDTPLNEVPMREQKYSPDQPLIFFVLLTSPDSLQGLQIDLEGTELVFIDSNNAVVHRIRYGREKYAILLPWPAIFMSEKDSRIVVSVAYTYKCKGEAVEAGMITRSIVF